MSIQALRLIGPHRGTSGYDRHVRQYIRCFQDLGVEVEVRNLPEWNSDTHPGDAGDDPFQQFYRRVSADATIHFCMPFQATPEPHGVNILHTMFEANRITKSWIRHSLEHDLVVVPSRSSREAWITSGMPRRQVVVCAQGVDLEQFDGSASPEPLSLPDGRPVSGFRTRFLNVAVASPRKNLAGLVRTWMSATTANDDAVLILKCGPAPGTWVNVVRRQIRQLQVSLGRDLSSAAPILILDRTMADADMPRLYAAATHYISMSFGEGWDQPMHEAAASNLRLISPDHSAYHDYISHQVADVIPSKLVPAVFAGDPGTLRFFAGAQWWQPDEHVAAAYIRAAIDGTSEPKSSPRDHIALSHSWNDSARELRTVVEKLLSGRERRRFWTRRPASTRG